MIPSLYKTKIINCTVLLLLGSSCYGQFLKKTLQKASAAIEEKIQQLPKKTIHKENKELTENSKMIYLDTAKAPTAQSKPRGAQTSVEIPLLEIKSPSKRLKKLFLTVHDNLILFPSQKSRSQKMEYSVAQNFERYFDLYKLKNFKSYIDQMNRESISFNSRDMEDRKDEQWSSSVFAQDFILKSALLHLAKKELLTYFCDDKNNDCSIDKENAVPTGGAWGGDFQNKFRTLEYYQKYMASGILEEAQGWAETLFKSDTQTYYVSVLTYFSDRDYDFQKQELTISVHTPNNFFGDINFMLEMETEGFSLNSEEKNKSSQTFKIPLKLSPAQAEELFKNNTPTDQRGYGNRV